MRGGARRRATRPAARRLSRARRSIGERRDDRRRRPGAALPARRGRDHAHGAAILRGHELPVGRRHAVGRRLLGARADDVRAARRPAPARRLAAGLGRRARATTTRWRRARATCSSSPTATDRHITHVAISLGDCAIVHLALGRGGFGIERLDDGADPYVRTLVERFSCARESALVNCHCEYRVLEYDEYRVPACGRSRNARSGLVSGSAASSSSTPYVRRACHGRSTRPTHSWEPVDRVRVLLLSCTRYSSWQSCSITTSTSASPPRCGAPGRADLQRHLGARVAVEPDAHHVASALVEREVELRDEREVHLDARPAAAWPRRARPRCSTARCPLGLIHCSVTVCEPTSSARALEVHHERRARMQRGQRCRPGVRRTRRGC